MDMIIKYYNYYKWAPKFIRNLSDGKFHKIIQRLFMHPEKITKLYNCVLSEINNDDANNDLNIILDYVIEGEK